MSLPILYPPFGTARYWISNPKGPHGSNNAVDWDTADDDAPIYAMHDGIVDDDQLDPDCGLSLHVTRDDGLRTLYCHLSRKLRTSGFVRAGTHIGDMGSTGESTGPHLHSAGRWQGVWTYLPLFPFSLEVKAVAVPIRVGETKRDSAEVVDAKSPVICRDTDGTPLFRYDRDVTLDYFGEPLGTKGWGTVQVKTARVDGKLGWWLLYARSGQLGRPRKNEADCTPYIEAIQAAKAALELVET